MRRPLTPRVCSQQQQQQQQKDGPLATQIECALPQPSHSRREEKNPKLAFTPQYKVWYATSSWYLMARAGTPDILRTVQSYAWRSDGRVQACSIRERRPTRPDTEPDAESGPNLVESSAISEPGNDPPGELPEPTLSFLFLFFLFTWGFFPLNSENRVNYKPCWHLHLFEWGLLKAIIVSPKNI
jgi:hypothetical protein